MRKKFVNFSGQITLLVPMSSGIDGYASMFKNWCQQIKHHIGDENYSNIIPSFSTTDMTAEACHNLSLMYGVKKIIQILMRRVWDIKNQTVRYGSRLGES